MVSFVSAADLNTTDDTIGDSINEDTISVDLDEDDDLKMSCESANDSSNVLSATYMANNFSDIQNYIDSANKGDTIVLNGNYNMESSDTIVINKQLNFRGINDATINGSSNKRLVTINANGVTFTGITFKNGGYDDYGGAIRSVYSFSASNCKFISNVGWWGGAIYASSSNFQLNNCIFENNSASEGGAVYVSKISSSCTVVNCKFVGNSARDGGAMYHGSAVNCSFVGNSAESSGGAIVSGTAMNCSFVSNSARSYGGGAMIRGSAVNCSFVGNSASNGGAMRDGSAVNCNFVNNSAQNGGAMSGSKVNNCTFIGNSAKKNGGALSDCYVANSLFKNNSASSNGGAISGIRASNCTFFNNHADKYGGAVYNANVSSSSIFKNNTANIGNDSYEVTIFKLDKIFSDLFSLINNNSEIFLNNNYTFEVIFDSDYVDGIVIDHDMIIYGNGFSIDGVNLAKIFTVTAENVVFKDIIFMNGKTSGDGGALSGGSAVNCSFVGNSASNGGALSGGSAVNCSFVGNSAKRDGGAIYRGIAVNCSFVGNSAQNDGGAMKGGSAVNCSFVGNSANYGGALSGGSAVNCSFVSNSARVYGGAMKGGSAVNCSFVSNSANGGGAIYQGSAVNCSFVGNSAQNDGGAIYRGSAVNCSFVGNSALYDGGAMRESSAVNCSFVGNSATNGGALYDGSAVNCSFVGNSATNGGALYDGSAVNCSFVGNSALYGGAIFEGTALNSSFRSNSANFGGAVFNVYATNSVFDNNSASVNGGAMSGKKAINCEFLNNYANEYGGAVFNAKISIDSFFSNNLANVGLDTYNVSFFSDEYVFKDLFSLINNDEYSEIYLDRDYAYDFTSDSDFVDGFIINRNLTIYGNGHIIDGSNQARIFTVTAGNVVFKDIIFMNGRTSGDGGALSGGSAVNCSFVSNSARVYGGAMKGGSAVNCSFVSNSANGGGAIYQGSAVNCSFVGNSAQNDGGAIYRGSAVNCSFVGNSALYDGGAMRESSAVNCSFVDNSAKRDGGALSGGSAMNCSFVGNSARVYGGAMRWSSAVNCSFVNNSARSYGGAIYEGSARYCSFINNTDKYGNAIYGTNNLWDCIFDIYPSFNLYYTSYLNVDNLTITKGECRFLIVKLFDIRGPLSNKCINFTVGGFNASNITDSEGIAYFDVSKYLTDSGFHDVNVTFYGEKFISFSSKIATVFLKYDPQFSFNNLSIAKGDDATFSVGLSNFYGPITGENIVFIINGQTLFKPTNGKGLANLNINDYLTDIGEYMFTIAYSGNDFTNPGSANATVCINHYIGNLTVNVTGKYYNDTVLTFKLINSKNNNPISDATINVTFSNGKNMTLKTDSDGVARYNVPFNPGTYNLTAKFIGEKNIDVNEVTLNNIKINEIVGVIELTQNGTGYNSSNLIIRTYNNVNNDIYRKIKVHLEFNNGKSFDVITNDEGIGIFHIPFDIGNYDALAYATGSYISFNQIELNNILIEKSDSIVNGNDIEFDFGESGSTTLELIGCNGLESYSVIGHSEAQISFDGSNITVSGLTVGKYNLTIVTIPDYNHNPITKNIGIAVNKALSDVEGNAIEFDYGSSGTTTLTVVGGSIANVSVVNAEANVSFEGNVVSVSGLDAGNYKLQVTTAPDEFHNPVTAFIDITVNKIDSSVSGEDIVFDYDSSGSTIVTVVGGDISKVRVVDHPEITPILSGNVVTVSGLDAGTYYLQVITAPDKNHNSITDKNIKITVNKIDSSVSGNEIVFGYGDTGSTTLTLVGASIKQADVTVVEYKANITLEGNKVYVSGLDYGNYTLKIITTPDSNHKSVTGYINITVNKAKADIGFSNTISFASDSSGTTHVTYITGGDIELSTISVIGHSQAGISYDKYTGVIRVSNLPVGSHTLIVTVIPDSNHEFITKTLGITVTASGSGGGKTDSKIDLENIVFTYGGSGSTIMTVVGGTVESSGISVDGHPEVKPKLVGNKIVVSGLNPGIYTLRVKTTPFTNYYSVTETVSITVNKVSSQITASSAMVVYKKSTKWTVKFTDSNGNPISGVKVTFKVYTGKNYKIQSIATNSKGEASYNTKELSKGNHKVIVSVSHIGYGYKEVTSSIKVIKPTALKFKVNRRESRESESTITFQILNKKTKKGVNGIKVKLMIKSGKKYKTFVLKSKTLKNKKGKKVKGVVGVITNEFSAGKHKVIIMPASIKYSGSGKSYIVIKKSATKRPPKTIKT